MRAFLIALIVILLSAPAFADCDVSPSGTRPEGAIVYNTDNKVLQYCDGTDWIQMHAPGTGSGGCSNPTGDESDIIYNFDFRVMQGCAGNVWQSMGPMKDRYGSLGAFDFTDQAGVTVSTLIESNIEQITGLMSAAPVSITGDGSPEYRTCTDGTSDANCDGSVVQNWTSTPGTVSDNEYLQLRLTTNAAFGTMDTATVSVGSANDVWNVTSAAQDTTPDAFSFTDFTDVPLSKLMTSNSVTINGITGSVSVAVSGDGSPEIRVNGGAWTAGPTTITNGQSLEVRLTTANTDTTMRSATVTVGTANDQWDLTTNDNTPNAFSFTDQTGVAVSTLTTSNSVNITGITGWVDVSVSGDGSPQIRVNGGGWAPSNAITNGQTLEVRLTSNAANSTMNSATVTVGTVSDQWDVTTEAGCVGAMVGGSCWIYGAGGLSCTTVCSGAGLSYDTATLTYAGTDGTLANCDAVLDALGVPGAGATYIISIYGLGCGYYSGARRVAQQATDAASSLAGYSRACACQ